jgi:hypothetical protein
MWSALVLFLGPAYGFDPAQKLLLTTVQAAVGAAGEVAVARLRRRLGPVASSLASVHRRGYVLRP